MQNSITRLSPDFARRLSLVVLACLLVSCSALRLGYSNGESVTYWWLNSYVNFEPEQQPWVRKRIDSFFAWHRKTQLSDYAQLLAHGQQQLEGTVTPEQVLTHYDGIRKRMLMAIDRALPDLAELALSLHPEQIASIEKKFASNNERYRKDYLRGDLEQRQRHRYKKVMKQAEYWFGDFSPEQEAQIRAASDARPLDNEIWMAERLRRQQELIVLLKRIQEEKPGREAATQMLRDYAAGMFDHFGDRKNKPFFDASREGTAKMVAVIVNIATPEQKAHAARRAQQWIDDFHTMNAKAH